MFGSEAHVLKLAPGSIWAMHGALEFHAPLAPVLLPHVLLLLQLVLAMCERAIVPKPAFPELFPVPTYLRLVPL